MKLFNVNQTTVSEEFHQIMLEGNKADWIALNQGEKLIAMGKKYNDHWMNGKTAQEIGDYLEKEGGKFAPYMAQLYIRGQVEKMEDMYQINRLIQKFNEHSKHIENKDITTYSLDELRKVLEPFEGKMSNNHVNPLKDKELEENGGIIKLISTPNFEVIMSHSKEASCYLGQDTEVCTANMNDEHNYHDHYYDQGHLYTIRAGKRRFLLHFETDQFKDEKNIDVSETDIHYLSNFPQYKDFLEMLIYKHYEEKDVVQRQMDKINKAKENHPKGKTIKEAVTTKEELRAIASDPQKAYEYANYVVRGRFQLGEAAIKTSDKYSVLYARNVLHETYDIDKIAQDPKLAYNYAKNILRGRFQLGEAAIRSDVKYAKLYVTNVLKSS